MEQLNQSQRSLIRTTAFAVLRNGAQYYEWLKTKRHPDPLYAFLVGGIGSKYYEWCIANENDARKEDASDRLRPESDIKDKKDKAERQPRRSRRDSSRSRSLSRSRSRSFRRPISRSPRLRLRSPARRWEEKGRDNPNRDRSDRERRRSRSAQRERRGVRHGKLYAWSSEEESSAKSSVILKQKLESMKQRLQNSSANVGA